MRNIFVTSNTDFFRFNVIRDRKRPFESWEEMNESLIMRWNNRVSPNDLVYHLGNFGASTTENLSKIRKQLNGKITIVIGDDIHIEGLLDIGFDSIAHEVTLQYKNYHFQMTHLPENQLIYDNMDHSLINLHGHCVSRPRVLNNRINVSSDVWDYNPVTIEDILMSYRRQRRYKNDKN